MQQAYSNLPIYLTKNLFILKSALYERMLLILNFFGLIFLMLFHFFSKFRTLAELKDKLREDPSFLKRIEGLQNLKESSEKNVYTYDITYYLPKTFCTFFKERSESPKIIATYQ